MLRHKFSGSLVIIAIVLIAMSCGGSNQRAEVKSEIQEPPQDAALIEVSIEGMFCLGCEQTIQNNVAKLDGIKSVKASFTVGNAVIEYFPGVVDTANIKEAVTGSGYQVIKFMPFEPEEAVY